MMQLFISFAIPFLLFEITCALFPNRYHNYLKKVTTNTRSGLILKEDKPFILFNLLYMIWTVAGLFTPYWSIFLAILALSIMSSVIGRGIDEDELKVKLRRSDAIIMIILLLGLLLNTLH